MSNPSRDLRGRTDEAIPDAVKIAVADGTASSILLDDVSLDASVASLCCARCLTKNRRYLERRI